MAGDEELGRLFAESAGIMARLRGPNGCPWDREQTHDSIRKYTLEETYEVLDAIERRDWAHLSEELGDLLLQVLFYAQMSEEAGDFGLAEVLSGLNRKLVRRHPHVFGEAAAAAAGNRAVDLQAVDGSAAVLTNWHAIKQMEKLLSGATQEAAGGAGYLAGILRNLPALSEAAKLGSAAARAGFDWPDVRGLLEKVREEAAELEAELASAAGDSVGSADEAAGVVDGVHGMAVRHPAIAEEYGDLLFTVANLGRHLKLDPEMALRDANAKFRRRFEAMERGSEPLLEALSAEELETAWAAVKAAEAAAARLAPTVVDKPASGNKSGNASERAAATASRENLVTVPGQSGEMMTDTSADAFPQELPRRDAERVLDPSPEAGKEVVSSAEVMPDRNESALFRTPGGVELAIRGCRGVDELQACVELQQQVWGYPDLEVTPRKAFLLARELGGQVIGAFEPAGRLVGFAMALPAMEPGEKAPRVYLHSHMLAVRPEYRNSGLGRRLKLAQRDDALARGIRKMTWTFDPLEAKNAYFNLHRLGAIARKYSPDFYGVSSSRLQGGLPTDRLHAEWWMQSAHVCARLAGAANQSQDQSQDRNREQDPGAPPAGAAERIVLPHQAQQWKGSEATLEQARAVQSANRELFRNAFARGLAVTDFSRDAEGNGVFELRTWDQTEDGLCKAAS